MRPAESGLDSGALPHGEVNDVSTALRDVSRLYELSAALSDALPATNRFESFVDRLARALAVDVCVVWLGEGEQKLTAAVGVPARHRPTLQLPRDLRLQLATSGSTPLVLDAAGTRQALPFLGHRASSGALVALRVAARTLGVLLVGRCQGTLSEGHVGLLAQLAPRAALAADHAQVYETLLQDIRNRHRNEALLREHERRYRAQTEHLQALLENIAPAVILFDAKQRLVACNSKVVEVLGVDPSIVSEGTSFETLVTAFSLRSGLSREQATERVVEQWAVASAGQPHLQLVEQPDRRIVEIRHLPLAAGGFVRMYEDVTARVRVAETLERAKEAAESANRAKSEFLANMSHEIRTPLNAVLALSRFALERAEHPEQREHLQLAISSAEALTSVLNDILDFSKIEAGHLSLEAVPFDLRALVREIARTFEPQAAGKGLALLRTVDPALPAAVVGDPARLRQVLLNLVSNAVKFTDTGYVQVAVEVRSQQAERVDLRLGVRDTGVGIPPEKRPLMFDAFTQADTSVTRRHGGTGLGLSIARRLVSLMGGTLGIEGPAGGGSLFLVDLSLPLAAAPVNLAGSPAVLPAPTPTQHRRPLRVLVAEDNVVNQRVARAYLERLGHQAVVAQNGREALSKLDGQPFDIVLMDVQMPEMDGIEATQAIRRGLVPGLVNIPIVALTAHAMEGDRERCLSAGMQAYLTKPIDADKLRRELERWTDACA